MSLQTFECVTVMPYFIIIPAYLLLLIVLIVTAIIVRFVPRLQPASGYILGATVGTLPGFIAANLIVTLAGLLPVMVAQKVSPPQWLHNAVTVLVAAALLVGPFVASAIGTIVGCAAGVYFVFKRRRRNDIGRAPNRGGSTCGAS